MAKESTATRTNSGLAPDFAVQDTEGRWRQLIQERLDTLLRPAAGWPASLLEAMRYGLLGPGKRLRPLLVLSATEACGGVVPEALSAGCAVEMVHSYSLVHDDLPAMDDDDLRRGRPTCHKQFGEALAILAGDALLTYAFEVLTNSYEAPLAAACCRELAVGAGAGGMVGGQVEDLAWENASEQLIIEDGARAAAAIEGIHARKTGALFRASLRMGGWVALVDKPIAVRDEVLATLDDFGRCFGQAFQITDDLLDVEGSTDRTGKNVGKDESRGKLTYPRLLGVEESRRLAQQLCERACVAAEQLPEGPGQLAALAQRLVNRDR